MKTGMKIGIVVHSQSGSTLKFGERIAEGLRKNGHSAEVVQLQCGPVEPRAANVPIGNIPDGSKFDILLFGGPVLGFAASPAIMGCIQSLKGLSGKKVLPFVTMGFPLPSMGGKQAIAQMSGALRSAGADVLPGIIIPKMFHNKARMMEDKATEIAALLK